MKALYIKFALLFIGPVIRSEIERYRAMDAKRAEEATCHAIEVSNFVDQQFQALVRRGQTSP